MLKRLSYLLISLILFATGSGKQLPPVIEAERVELPVRYGKGEKIR